MARRSLLLVAPLPTRGSGPRAPIERTSAAVAGPAAAAAASPCNDYSLGGKPLWQHSETCRASSMLGASTKTRGEHGDM